MSGIQKWFTVFSISKEIERCRMSIESIIWPSLIEGELPEVLNFHLLNTKLPTLPSKVCVSYSTFILIQDATIYAGSNISKLLVYSSTFKNCTNVDCGTINISSTEASAAVANSCFTNCQARWGSCVFRNHDINVIGLTHLSQISVSYSYDVEYEAISFRGGTQFLDNINISHAKAVRTCIGIASFNPITLRHVIIDECRVNSVCIHIGNGVPQVFRCALVKNSMINLIYHPGLFVVYS